MWEHPLESAPSEWRAPGFGLLLLATFLCGAALSVLDGPLRTAAAPAGIVSFELAGSVERAAAILASWGPPGRLHAAFGLGLDFLFLALYSTLLAAACLWAGRRGGRRGAGWGRALAWAQWGAAGLDAGENVALWLVLAGSVTGPWPQAASLLARAKFGLIGAGLAYAGAGALRAGRERPGPRPTRHEEE